MGSTAIGKLGTPLHLCCCCVAMPTEWLAAAACVACVCLLFVMLPTGVSNAFSRGSPCLEHQEVPWVMIGGGCHCSSMLHSPQGELSVENTLSSVRLRGLLRALGLCTILPPHLPGPRAATPCLHSFAHMLTHATKLTHLNPSSVSTSPH